MQGGSQHSNFAEHNACAETERDTMLEADRDGKRFVQRAGKVERDYRNPAPCNTAGFFGSTGRGRTFSGGACIGCEGSRELKTRRWRAEVPGQSEMHCKKSKCRMSCSLTNLKTRRSKKSTMMTKICSGLLLPNTVSLLVVVVGVVGNTYLQSALAIMISTLLRQPERMRLNAKMNGLRWQKRRMRTMAREFQRCKQKYKNFRTDFKLKRSYPRGRKMIRPALLATSVRTRRLKPQIRKRILLLIWQKRQSAKKRNRRSRGHRGQSWRKSLLSLERRPDSTHATLCRNSRKRSLLNWQNSTMCLQHKMKKMASLTRFLRSRRKIHKPCNKRGILKANKMAGTKPKSLRRKRLV
eukprot:29788_2